MIAVATAAATATGAIGVITGASGESAKSKTTAKFASAKDCGPGGGWGRRGGPVGVTSDQLDKIASKLGIETTKLKAALDKVRTGARADRRQAFADELAKALGVDSAKVLKILHDNAPQRPATPPSPGTRPQHPDRSKLVTALAQGLGVSEDKVTSALGTLRDERRDKAGPRDDLFTKLAAELGLDQSKVKAAFQDVIGKPGAAGGPGAAWGRHGRGHR